MAQRKKLLLVQENLQPPGGGQAVAAWAVQALSADYDLDILTWVPIETHAINAFYGTQLEPRQFRNLEFPALVRKLVNRDPDPYSFQPLALLLRCAKLMRSRYDLLLGLANEMDFGVRGIQYFHYPYLGINYRNIYAAGTLPHLTLRRQLDFYLRPWRLISGFRFNGMKQNVTLVNSDWTGARVQQVYNIPTRTLYPPITGQISAIPWSDRANGFVCIGRLSSEKKYEQVIEILTAVRARGCPVQLHLVVSIPPFHADTAYCAKIRAYAQQHSDWVHWHENIPRAALEQLIATQRYGIHAMPDEHFGMGIAEMVRGGCLVFVPNSGGQVEIVAHDQRLVFASSAQAAEKITRVLDEPNTQRELQTVFAARAELYSAAHFMNEIRAIVAQQFQTA